MSPSSRRAWIEMYVASSKTTILSVALLAEGVDRNHPRRDRWYRTASPSSRRAWIEIPAIWRRRKRSPVALLAEGVDRNWLIAVVTPTPFREVALLAEGVDRNTFRAVPLSVSFLSPSSRRAWIEIPCPCTGSGGRGVALLAEGVDRNDTPIIPSSRGFVALLAEGVDRNTKDEFLNMMTKESPSSRRAWIEMEKKAAKLGADAVALLAEGVDRNTRNALLLDFISPCRPPRGGRG